ncbi:phospholipid carrier-dependent glycosyltransferase [Hymenobacter oligotrophus]|uniref:Phospholipid carrier-dependent glycosyltransferase n=1 Tax=Hymenobacter oligotrophus TaxID=2319843 RepID=A0A3B7R1W5_9BACT|nr:glycosyltransferase family 39 protein [Hymenobacter oligotrophus]AYA38094.1 phospholipid carrier-dependent glycosyltransferase [Hymenobacter oligotrophus]
MKRFVPVSSPVSAKSDWRRWLPLLLLLGLSFIPLFWLLSSLPVQQWDEARTGLNGLGIWLHHDWIVLRHLGEPDLWNGKPPLWPWLLALSFRVFGPNELGLRLPAALVALATVLLVYRAGHHWLGSRRAGLLAGLVLLTSQGYVTLHVTRTGDYDTLLTFWATAGALSWLAYLRTGTARWAWLTGAAFALALFTKGIAGVLFGPGLLVAVALTKQWQRLRHPVPWLAAGLVLITAVGWYTVRELAAPGYLAGVWAYEVGGPAGEQLEEHYHPFEWYLSLLAERKFTAWLLAALLGWLIGFWQPQHSPGWWLSRFTAAVAVSFLLSISLVQTRLEWYDAQVYPLLALQAAAGLVWTGRALAAHFGRQPKELLRLGGVLAVAAFPYLAQWQHIRMLHKHRLDWSQLLYGRHIQAQAAKLPELRQYTLVTEAIFNDSPEFYRTAAEMQYGHQVERLASWQTDKGYPGKIIVTCGDRAARHWLQQYETQVLLQTDSCKTVRLLARKQP